jgi:ERCC4-type nuclease
MSSSTSANITIKIDVREHDLIYMFEKNILFRDVKVQKENLPLGDVIIMDGDEEKIIIERKTLSDLAASIKDGRYEEQGYRLNGCNHHNHNIVYLIEGDVSKYNIFKGRLDKMTLYSAMFSINYYKGFSLMRSNSLEESALIILNMVQKMSKSMKTSYYSNSSNPNPNLKQNQSSLDTSNTDDPDTLENTLTKEESEEKEYCGVVKKVKKDNITVANIGEIMLCQIPTISSITALAILAKFHTITQLILSIQQDVNCMKDISYVNSKGQTRKISKTSIANIIKFLQV